MLLWSLLGWWYLSGWSWLSKEMMKKLDSIRETFSVGILIKTLFSPWKQIQTAASFNNFFQAAIDNSISRLIGAVIRIFMLIGALLIWTSVLLCGLLFIILWPVLPLMLVILPLLALSGTEIL